MYKYRFQALGLVLFVIALFWATTMHGPLRFELQGSRESDVDDGRTALEHQFDFIVEAIETSCEKIVVEMRKDLGKYCPHKPTFYKEFLEWVMEEYHIFYGNTWADGARPFTRAIKDGWTVENEAKWRHESWEGINGGKFFYDAQDRYAIAAEDDRSTMDRPDINSPAPRPESVTILTATNAAEGSGYLYALQAIEQRDAYAAYYGNKHRFLNLTVYTASQAEHPVWYKLPAIQDTFANDPDCEWVWWIDSDAVLMNGNLNISRDLLSHDAISKRSLLEFPVSEVGDRYYHGGNTETSVNPEDIHFIVAHDFLSFNMGSFLIHRSQWASEVIEMWGSPTQIYDRNRDMRFFRREQDGYIRLWHDHDFVRKATAVFPANAINPFVVRGPNRWSAGDFLVHFAGRSSYGSYDDEWKKAFQRASVPGSSVEDAPWGKIEI